MNTASSRDGSHGAIKDVSLTVGTLFGKEEERAIFEYGLRAKHDQQPTDQPLCVALEESLPLLSADQTSLAMSYDGDNLNIVLAMAKMHILELHLRYWKHQRGLQPDGRYSNKPQAIWALLYKCPKECGNIETITRASGILSSFRLVNFFIILCALKRVHAKR